MPKKDQENAHYFRTLIIFLLCIGMGVILYARFIGTKGLVVKEYVVESPKLSANFHGLKIVHFSDLHYGSTVFIPEVEKIVKEINALKPDIIFFTGDLIDSSYPIKTDEITKLTDILNKLKPEIAAYIIKGNHDQTMAYEEALTKLSFKHLANGQELFYYGENTPLLIIGLDDMFGGHYNLDEAFANLEENEYYTILLGHEPDMIDAVLAKDYKVDLFLSGHSHNGQVRLPFVGAIVKAPGAHLYYEAEYQLKDTRIFISGGIGTSNYPFRLFNKPSFNLYRFFT